jgi:hypothetical protein
MGVKKIKFILLLELPSSVLTDKRQIITKELKMISYEKPKRNVFLIEVEKEKEMVKIKE